MALTISVHFDMEPLVDYFRLIVTPGGKYFNALTTLWAVRYRREMLKRWRKESRGGGAWPPLKASTIKRRRNKVKGSIKILIDTGIMRDALTPGVMMDTRQPGAYAEQIPQGLRIGFGGPDRHAGTGGSVSIARLALWHHKGAGRLPRREVLVHPGLLTQKGMTNDVFMIFNKIKRDTGMS